MPTFQHDGLELFFIDVPGNPASQGAPVVLVHGFASTHAVNWINPLWVKALTDAGRRVIALDNRGHGASGKPHAVAAYHTSRMAADVLALVDHLGIEAAHLMGYSMGARICAFATLAAPVRVRAVVLGGLGYHLVEGGGLPTSIADAMRAPSVDAISDPTGRLFRRFAEANGGDLEALAACIEGSRQSLGAGELARLVAPVLVAVGDKDPIAGDPHRLAALLPHGSALDIPGRDHNLAVGDKLFKAAAIRFFASHDEPVASGGPDGMS